MECIVGSAQEDPSATSGSAVFVAEVLAMVELEPVVWNFTLNGSHTNESGSGYPRDEFNNIVHLTETKILPAFVGFLCSTGLVGNVLVLVTILRSAKKTVPDVYVGNLAVADLVHVTVMPFLIHQWARGGHWVFGSTLCTIITSLDNCNQVACAAVMTAMSLDRYLALVHPFRLLSLRTRSRTIRINLFVWAASLVMVLPAWIHSKVIRFRDGLESCSLNLVSPKEVLWYTVYQTITSFFLPLPLIVICYILILCYTWRMYGKNKKAHRYCTNLPRERIVRLTKMVLVLVAVFLVSVGPYHVLQLVNLSVPRPSLAYHTCYYLSVCLSYAASSINPFIYILFSGHFRHRLVCRDTPSMPSVEREIQPRSSF
ncbi:melanin-concentrating hormone receptor 2 [Triplophysa dalaica]|uniref:melanin-concentrating hormone receptor 2 n=1 Tax=Triplophysa dalaica TaxID=1582913 RepID=UPI0024DFE78B|nr:melanin-concentrating hormone receptor 2 [Triplophysa dalaica]